MQQPGERGGDERGSDKASFRKGESNAGCALLTRYPAHFPRVPKQKAGQGFQGKELWRVHITIYAKNKNLTQDDVVLVHRERDDVRLNGLWTFATKFELQNLWIFNFPVAMSSYSSSYVLISTIHPSLIPWCSHIFFSKIFCHSNTKKFCFLHMFFLLGFFKH